MSVLIFNGTSSASVHAHISEPPEYAIPEREYETIHVTGRNGDLIIDSDCYQNVERTYKMTMDATSEALDYSDVASAIATWLLPPSRDSKHGYFELLDSYDPKYYRLAKFKGGDSISNIFNKAGEFDLSFECKPQRFLVEGKSTTSNYTNPTLQIAKPVITLQASNTAASFTVKSTAYNYERTCLISTTDRITIDCEEENVSLASNALSNRNAYFKVRNEHGVEVFEFPVLHPGANTITLSTSISSFSLIPNWWEL